MPEYEMAVVLAEAADTFVEKVPLVDRDALRDFILIPEYDGGGSKEIDAFINKYGTEKLSEIMQSIDVGSVILGVDHNSFKAAIRNRILH